MNTTQDRVVEKVVFCVGFFVRGERGKFEKTAIKTMGHPKNDVSYESAHPNPSNHVFISKLTFLRGWGVICSKTMTDRLSPFVFRSLF